MTPSVDKPIILCSVDTQSGHGRMDHWYLSFSAILDVKRAAEEAEMPFDVEGIIAWEHDRWALNHDTLLIWRNKTQNRMIRSVPQTDMSRIFFEDAKDLFGQRTVCERVCFGTSNPDHFKPWGTDKLKEEKPITLVAFKEEVQPQIIQGPLLQIKSCEDWIQLMQSRILETTLHLNLPEIDDQGRNKIRL